MQGGCVRGEDVKDAGGTGGAGRDNIAMFPKIQAFDALWEVYSATGLAQKSPNSKAIISTGLAVIETLLRKNADYGGSVYKSPTLMPTMSARDACLVRLSDKVERFCNLQKNGGAGLVAESLEDTLKDFCGYSILALSMMGPQRGE